VTELAIDRVNLQIVGAAGQEHRVHAISRRAIELLGERLVELGPDLPAGETAIPSLGVPPLSLDLGRSDEEMCARLLVDSMLDAVRLRMVG